ncbi:MAG: hypothetical protein KDD62_15000, partial [Bdellovibrionales bacterium]|nr:hypothetical protein [Bdellovibrionales bacterium]
GSILHPWSLSEVSGEAEQHNRNLLERTQAHPSPFAKKGLLPRPFNRIPRALRVSHEQSILQAVNDSNHQAELLFATAQALRADGHSYAAMECMQHAVFINPDDTRYVFELARIYMDRDQREAFERCFDRLMYLNPKDERLAEFPHKSELHG